MLISSDFTDNYLKIIIRKQANINYPLKAFLEFDEMTNFNWHIGIFAH